MKRLYQKDQRDNKVRKSRVYCPYCKRDHIVNQVGHDVFYCTYILKRFDGDQNLLSKYE